LENKMKKILIVLFCIFVAPVVSASNAIKIIVPYAVGGPADLAARIIQTALSQDLQRPVVVENRPGAGGLLGVMAAIQADPKEQVLLLTGASPVLTNLIKQPPQVTADQLVPISYVGTMEYMLVSTHKFGARSITDWRKIDKSRPIMMGTGGSGSGTETMTISFNQIMNKNVVLVNYKGIAPTFIDLLAGNLDAGFVAGTMAHESIKNNKLLAVATTSPNRLPEFPNVPTMKEMGVNGLVNLSWMMIFSNRNNNPVQITKIQQRLSSIMRDPGIVEKMNQIGIDSTPPAVSLQSFFEDEQNKFFKLSHQQKQQQNQ